MALHFLQPQCEAWGVRLLQSSGALGVFGAGGSIVGLRALGEFSVLITGFGFPKPETVNRRGFGCCAFGVVV